MHIGRQIQKTLACKGMTVVAFARSIPTSRENAYRIFKKRNIDIQLLQRICLVLEHDFFKDLSKDLSKDFSGGISGSGHFGAA